MSFSSWMLEFCSAFYSTYTINGEPNNVGDILTTITTAATTVGVPNGYVEAKDVQYMNTTSMYIESLSDEELKTIRQELESDMIYKDLDLSNKDYTNIKTL